MKFSGENARFFIVFVFGISVVSSVCFVLFSAVSLM
jgi:hypothetical protein